MSIGQIIVLTGVVSAFVLFAAVLAWADYRAQQRAGGIRESNRTGAPVAPPAAEAGKIAIPATAHARWPQKSDDRLPHVA